MFLYYKKGSTRTISSITSCTLSVNHTAIHIFHTLFYTHRFGMEKDEGDKLDLNIK